MSERRKYERTRLEAGGWGAVVTCSCGATAELPTATGKTHLPREAISQKFRNRGWHIGPVARKDRCPECIGRKHQQEEVVTMKPSERLEAMKEPTPPKPGASAEPPRVMGREDRQIVFAKLSDVYLGEAVGYDRDWNDDRVSRDLNCPRAWVVEVREQFFGPIRADQSAEVIAIREKVAALEHELTKQALATSPLSRDGKSLRGELERLAGEVAAFMGKIDGYTADIASLQTSLRVIGKGLNEARSELRKITGAGA